MHILESLTEMFFTMIIYYPDRQLERNVLKVLYVTMTQSV